MWILGYQDEPLDAFFWDKVDELPDCFIIQREIGKALDGESFFIFDERHQKKRCQGISQSEFFYYFRIWDDFHFFGLPNGKGSSFEKRWLLDFLKLFQNTYNMTLNFIESKK